VLLPGTAAVVAAAAAMLLGADVRRLSCMQQVENYEYELPSDFEDEEIDEEAAFTAEDKKLYAGWFGEDADEDAEQQQGGSNGVMDAAAGQQRRSKRSKLGEFADLESSSEEEQDEEGDEVGICCMLV
jgi:U3 small nucleolar RNA-associated protein 14